MAKHLDGQFVLFLMDAYEQYGGCWILDSSIFSKHNLTDADLAWAVRNRYMNHRGNSYALANRSIELLKKIGINTEEN